MGGWVGRGGTPPPPKRIPGVCGGSRVVGFACARACIRERIHQPLHIQRGGTLCVRTRECICVCNRCVAPTPTLVLGCAGPARKAATNVDLVVSIPLVAPSGLGPTHAQGEERTCSVCAHGVVRVLAEYWLTGDRNESPLPLSIANALRADIQAPSAA